MIENDFQYIKGFKAAMERYDKNEPVNLGSSFEISIKDLSETIARLAGFQGKIAWDRTKPNGQARRMLDTSRAQREFGFRAIISFELGLSKTITWYHELKYRIGNIAVSK